MLMTDGCAAVHESFARASRQVNQGTKWACNLWIWEHGNGPQEGATGGEDVAATATAATAAS